MLVKNRAILKFLERERKPNFVQRHPQFSFLSFALVVGIIACNATAVTPAAPATTNGKVMALSESVGMAFHENAFPNSITDDHTQGLKTMPITQSAIPITLSVKPVKGTALADLTSSPNTASTTATDAVTDLGAIDAAETTSTQAPTTTAETQPLLSSVPFDAETQHRILEEACNGDLQMFCLAMAIAQKESQFVPDLIGDNGLSYGYYQIKTDSHANRITKFGFTKDDLFDPVKGGIVCVDYLTELLWTYQGSGEVTHFLFMMYNQGPSSARDSLKRVTSTKYSRATMSFYEAYLAEAGLPSGVPFTQ